MRLTPSLVEEAGRPSKHKSLLRKILALALKVLAGIAAGVAVLCPLSTFTEIIVFFASVAVAIICYGFLTNMDETDIDEYGNNGYWPKPLNWNASPKAQGLSTEDTAAK